MNVVGYLSAESGSGEAARRMIEGLLATGVRVAAINYAKRSPSRQEHRLDALEPWLTDTPLYDVNLICLNAENFEAFAYTVGPAFFEDRASIAYWWWELPVFPEHYRHAFALLDEVWVGSDYVAEAIRPATSKPVVTIPLPLSFSEPPRISRQELGLPSGFMFLFAFDFFGIFERKNPLGLIEAFKRAFAPGSEPLLVVKSINGERFPVEAARLRAAAAGRPDILLIDRYLSAPENHALMAECDCYASLHRAEGFGLTLAEAMARGKPVIATGYSGNLAFMHENNSFLVPYARSRTPEGVLPYPPGVEWAEPDLAEAARFMREVYESPAEATRRAHRGQREIREQHSVERAGAVAAARVVHVRDRDRKGNVGEAWLEAVIGSALERIGLAGQRTDQYLLTAPSRFGAPVRTLRRLLWRLLWPYFFRERTLNDDIVGALQALRLAHQSQTRRLAALERKGFPGEDP